jgi:hypothetical protein
LEFQASLTNKVEFAGVEGKEWLENPGAVGFRRHALNRGEWILYAIWHFTVRL